MLGPSSVDGQSSRQAEAFSLGLPKTPLVCLGSRRDSEGAKKFETSTQSSDRVLKQEDGQVNLVPAEPPTE